jgi:hypothetical protein
MKLERVIQKTSKGVTAVTSFFIINGLRLECSNCFLATLVFHIDLMRFTISF